MKKLILLILGAVFVIGVSAQTTVSSLTTTTSINDADWIMLVQAGNSRKIAVSNLLQNMAPLASPTLVTPDLGTPSAVVLTNATGTAASLTAGAVTNGVYTTDTATMLTPYINRADTAAMLTNYINKADTASMLTPYINRADTATMLTPYAHKASPEFTNQITIGSEPITEEVAGYLDFTSSGQDQLNNVVLGEDYVVFLSPDSTAYTDDQTLVLGDAGNDIYVTKSTHVEITVPPNGDVAIPIGTTINFFQGGAGGIRFLPGSGVHIESLNDSIQTDGINSVAGLKKRGTNHWILYGNIQQ